MAKADDLSITIGWMLLREAVERAGSFDALLPYLLDGRIMARHGGLFRCPQGSAVIRPDRYIPSRWWTKVRDAEPAASRCWFTYSWAPANGSKIVRETLAIGIELERGAVDRWFPAGPAERIDEAQPTKSAVQKLKPKAWLTKARTDYPQQPDEDTRGYAARLHPLQEGTVTKPWSIETLIRRLQEAAKTEREAARGKR